MRDSTARDDLQVILGRIEEDAKRLGAVSRGKAGDLEGVAGKIGALVKGARQLAEGAEGVFEPPLKIDHMGIAVRDLRQAARLYTDFLGARIVAGGINFAARLRTIFVQFPDGGKVELLQPTGENAIHQFLEKRGEGIHHVTILVRDVAAMAQKLKDAGFRVVDEDFTAIGWKEAYISPRSALGCVLQIVEVGPQYGKPVEGITIDDVLADEWEWVDQKPRRRSFSSSDAIVS
jgi:methylmalonyl-CoA/ethylmalonyl-CoA epimerase